MVVTLVKKTSEYLKALTLSAYASQLTIRILLVLFPALLVLLTLLGFWFNPDELVTTILQSLKDIVPADVLDLIGMNIGGLLAEGSLTVFSIGFLLLFFSTSGFFRDLMNILNSIYEVKEHRQWWKRILLSLFFLISGIFLTLGIIQLLFISEEFVKFMIGLFNLPPVDLSFLFWRWPLILIIVFVFTYLSHVFIPNQPRHFWKHKIPGTLIFTFFWLITSLIFNWYVSNFGDYNKTYGILGGVILLLLYIQINVRLYLLGGALNSYIINHKGHRKILAFFKNIW